MPIRMSCVAVSARGPSMGRSLWSTRRKSPVSDCSIAVPAHLAVALRGVRVPHVEARARVVHREVEGAAGAEVLDVEVAAERPPAGADACTPGTVHPRLPHRRRARRDGQDAHERRQRHPDAVRDERYLAPIDLGSADEVAHRRHVERLVVRRRARITGAEHAALWSGAVDAVGDARPQGEDLDLEHVARLGAPRRRRDR